MGLARDYFYYSATFSFVIFLLALGLAIGGYFLPMNRAANLSALEKEVDELIASADGKCSLGECFNISQEIAEATNFTCTNDTCNSISSDISELQSQVDLLFSVFEFPNTTYTDEVGAVIRLNINAGVTFLSGDLVTNDVNMTALSLETINGQTVDFGGPNGIATLDENANLPLEQLTPANAPNIINSDHQTLTSEKWESIFIFDTSNSELTNITLNEGTEGNTVIISLLFKRGLPAHIRTLPYGTVLLSPTDSVKSLTFYQGVWKVINSDVDSFYPTEQQGEKLPLTGVDATAFGGDSVSLSADGNTLAIGAQQDASNKGAVLIFVRESNGTWVQQGDKLVTTDGTGAEKFGASVSLSADGNTLAAGGNADDTNQGATWVFVRLSNNTWIQQGDKLIGTNSSATAQQGGSVSLSADGNTLAVGGLADTPLGATWIFIRLSNDTWVQQGDKLTGSNSTDLGQGSAVSLSADGNTLAIGNESEESETGAVWIFVRSPESIWSQQGEKLVGTGGVAFQHQGHAVSLNADGNTLALGGFFTAIFLAEDDSTLGSTWIFTRSGTTWTQQGEKLIGTGGTGSAQEQGYAVSLSADGNTVAIGGRGDDSSTGATWVFTRSGTEWTQQNEKLVGTDSGVGEAQGTSVSLSADGNTVAIGGPSGDSGRGSVWIFI